MSLTVRVATPEDRRVAFDTVLAPSFVFDELEPFDEFDAKLDDGVTTLLVGADDESGEIVAAAVFVNVRAASAVVLRQMATREDLRRHRPGLRAVPRASSPPWRRPSSRVWCWPRSSTPTTTKPHPRHGDPLSRLRFYDRFDAVIIDVPYYQPALTARDSSRSTACCCSRCTSARI